MSIVTHKIPIMSFKRFLTKHSHRVLIMSQCEWILYESGHSFLMKASRILYQTVSDSLQCWCSRLKRTKMVIKDIFRVLSCWKNVLAVYFMLNTCILIVFRQMYVL